VTAERGYKPVSAPFGPPDVWPSGRNPGYDVYASAHGRNLAGVETMNADEVENYPNELNLLAEADDIDGNGVFDPNLTHGNVHPNEGVFAAHYSLPGYVEREHFYSPSEVTSLPRGGDVMYVPGGAVAFQQGQPETLRANNLLWELPPGVAPFQYDPLTQQQIVDAPTATYPVGATDGAAASTKMWWIAGAVGVAVGAALLLRKGRR
jgi:hypothetical protein